MRIKELSAGLVAPLHHSEWGGVGLGPARPAVWSRPARTQRTRERVKHAPAKAARLRDKDVQMWATAKTELYRNR